MKYLFLILLFVCQLAGATKYYVATDGSDTDPGTLAEPFATWAKGITEASAGDTIYLRGGSYSVGTGSTSLTITKDGTADAYINLWNYPGETPVLNLANNAATVGFSSGVTFNGANYWHVKGIEIWNMPQKSSTHTPVGLAITNSHDVIVENCIVHDVGYVCFYPTTGDDQISFINCDAYNSYDSLSTGANADGGNADGWHISYLATGDTITLKKCRMWNISDDGIDCFNSDGVIIIDSCWAFRNGVQGNGGGNGFKMGPHWTTPSLDTTRFVRNCLAFDNTGVGFTPNALRRIECFYNNIAYRNGDQGFQDFTDTIPNVYHNNIAYSTGTAHSIKSTDIHTYNSWNTPPGVTITSADFVSLDTTGVTGARTAGTLPVLDFLKLASGSDLIDAGTDVGLTYEGTAPDLGPYEYSNDPEPKPVIPLRYTIKNEGSVRVKIHSGSIRIK